MGGKDDIGGLPTVPGKGAGVSEALYGASLGAGALAGPYQVEVAGASGGFAAVYRARDTRAERPHVAIKVLHQMLVHSPNMLQRFEREIETLCRLDHPSIVPVLDIGTLEDGRPFYVMPWLDGRTLESYLVERGALSVAEANAILRAIGGAVATAHAIQVVHRDIKPSNVMMMSEEPLDVRLLDFGIAKIVTDETTGRHDLTSTGNRVGTPHYMAPEQIAGRAIDPRTDIYALGVVLYQMVTGQLPFTAPTPIEVEAKHLYAPPPRASEVAGTPPALDDVIARCMAKDASDRFATIGELLDAAEAATRDPRSSAVVTTAPEPAVGLHVEARTSSADPSDAVLDAMEDVIDRARALCAERGLEIAAEGGVSFLAVAPGDDVKVRREMVELGRAAAALANEEIRVTVTVHVGLVERSADRSCEGELLRIATWIADAGATEIVVTARAAVGLEGDLEPMGANGWRVPIR